MRGVHVSYNEWGRNSKQSGHKNVTYINVISKILSRVCYILLSKQTKVFKSDLRQHDSIKMLVPPVDRRKNVTFIHSHPPRCRKIIASRITLGFVYLWDT